MVNSVIVEIRYGGEWLESKQRFHIIELGLEYERILMHCVKNGQKSIPELIRAAHI